MSRIRTAVRRWLGIEVQAWKYDLTIHTTNLERRAVVRIPTPPKKPGNWELVAVGIHGLDVVYWWKAPAAEGQPPLKTPTPKPEITWDRG